MYSKAELAVECLQRMADAMELIALCAFDSFDNDIPLTDEQYERMVVLVTKIAEMSPE